MFALVNQPSPCGRICKQMWGPRKRWMRRPKSVLHIKQNQKLFNQNR